MVDIAAGLLHLAVNLFLTSGTASLLDIVSRFVGEIAERLCAREEREDCSRFLTGLRLLDQDVPQVDGFAGFDGEALPEPRARRTTREFDDSIVRTGDQSRECDAALGVGHGLFRVIDGIDREQPTRLAAEAVRVPGARLPGSRSGMMIIETMYLFR